VARRGERYRPGYVFFRAKFVLQELVDGKVRASAPIVIF